MPPLLSIKSGLLDSAIDHTQHVAADVFTVTLQELAAG